MDAETEPERKLELGEDQGRLKQPLIPYRYIMLAFAALGVMICYADRSNLAMAIIPMSREFQWNTAQQGLLLSCFYYGYVLTQVLGGVLANKYGGKLIFGIGSIFWAVLSAITPACARTHLFAAVACRIALGISEGVGYPAIHAIIGRSFPASEYARSTSFISASGLLGAILAYVVSSSLIVNLGWPWIFYIFAIVNGIWVLIWLFLIKEPPPRDQEKEQLRSQTDTVADAEPPPIEDAKGLDRHQEEESKDQAEKATIPWKRIFSSSYVWAIVITHYCGSWSYFVLLQWLPTFYEQKFQATMSSLGFVSMIPYLAALFGCLISGFLSDYLLRHQYISVRVLRKWSQIFAMVTNASCLLLAAFVAKSLVQGILFITLAMAFGSTAAAGSAIGHLDVDPDLAGVIYGISNTVGALPGIIGVQVTGLILHYTGNWELVFVVGVAHSFFGAIVWMIFGNPDKASIKQKPLIVGEK